MPEMWKELSKPEHFQFNPSENDEDWTGKRTFLRDDVNGTILPADLPVPGISNVNFRATPYYRGGYQPLSFLAREVEIVFQKAAESTEGQLYIVNYAAKSLSDRDFPNSQTATESLSISSTVMTLKNKAKNANNFKWAANGGAVRVDNVTFRIFMITADYSISDPGYLNFAAAIASIGAPGTVSNADSRWLIMGGNISEYRDDQDNERYRVVRSYKYKRIPGPDFEAGIVDIDKGWQLVWNPDVQKFDKTAPLLYATSAPPDILPTIP
jgi:hypothetical protein